MKSDLTKRLEALEARIQVLIEEMQDAESPPMKPAYSYFDDELYKVAIVSSEDPEERFTDHVSADNIKLAAEWAQRYYEDSSAVAPPTDGFWMIESITFVDVVIVVQVPKWTKK